MQSVTEAIVNAVVHRDYLSTGSVQVMLFKDRLEVWNPGRLPKGMTIKKLNGEHTSLPVNPLLANPVYLAGYIEQVGTGTNDLIERCVAMGLRKPEFRQDDDFTVVLWRETEVVESTLPDKLPDKLPNKLPDKLLNLLKENGELTINQMSDILGISEKSVRIYLKKLTEDGLLVRVGARKYIMSNNKRTPWSIVKGINNYHKLCQ